MNIHNWDEIKYWLISTKSLEFIIEKNIFDTSSSHQEVLDETLDLRSNYQTNQLYKIQLYMAEFYFSGCVGQNQD